MKIVDEASQYGARSFSLHLFGEPLLYPEWMSAINYIKKRNKNHTVLLTTNGTKINEYIDLLTRLPIDRCIWSWRTEAKFTPKTIEKLKKWKPFTVRYIEGTYPKEALEEKWPRVERRRMHNYGGNISLSTFGVKDTMIGKRWPCYHLWLAPAISWNGNLLLCCSDPHQKEVIGNLEGKTVKELWSGTMIENIRQSHLRGEFSGICRNCDVWKEYPNLFFGHEYAQST